MIALTCEQVRELLPGAAADALPEEVALPLRTHLAHCSACRADAELVQALRLAVAPLPRGLEGRVLAQAAAARRTRRWGTAGQLAMAATLAAAVLGGRLLFEVGRSPREAPSTPLPAGQATLPLPGLEDPVLRGGSFLPELTEAELEILLERLES